MADVRTLVRVPAGAKVGEVIEVSALIAHPMETGYRVDAEGKAQARNILRRCTVHFEAAGQAPELLFSADLHPAIAANPYLAFQLRVRQAGTLQLRWEGDQGFVHTDSATLTVA